MNDVGPLNSVRTKRWASEITPRTPIFFCKLHDKHQSPEMYHPPPPANQGPPIHWDEMDVHLQRKVVLPTRHIPKGQMRENVFKHSPDIFHMPTAQICSIVKKGNLLCHRVASTAPWISPKWMAVLHSSPVILIRTTKGLQCPRETNTELRHLGSSTAQPKIYTD